MRKLIASMALACLALSAFAVFVPKGTKIRLEFVDGLSSKTARIGDEVLFKVVEDIVVDGKVVIRKGTEATGNVRKVERGRRFGVNARVTIDLREVEAVDGTRVPVSDQKRGKMMGSGTDKAAVASGAGALVLGPIGLGIGYFVTGKEVNVKPGDTMQTQVSEDTKLKEGQPPSGPSSGVTQLSSVCGRSGTRPLSTLSTIESTNRVKNVARTAITKYGPPMVRHIAMPATAQMLAAVVNPLMCGPCRRIVPAPRKPIPATI